MSILPESPMAALIVVLACVFIAIPPAFYWTLFGFAQLLIRVAGLINWALSKYEDMTQ